MPTLRFEATRDRPLLLVTFDEALEEEIAFGANVTDHPVEGSARSQEFVQDHSQRKPNILTAEVVVTETPFPTGMGNIPSQGAPRIVSPYALLDDRLQDPCYYISTRIGVQGPFLLESATMTWGNPDMATIRLEMKQVRFAFSEQVELPPAVPKKIKKKKNPGPQTKTRDKKNTSRLASELFLGTGDITRTASKAAASISKKLNLSTLFN